MDSIHVTGLLLIMGQTERFLDAFESVFIIGICYNTHILMSLLKFKMYAQFTIMKLKVYI